MPALVYNPSRTLRIVGLVSSALVGLILLRAIFNRSPNTRRSSRLRVEEPVVLILVHPSPSLSKAANFELKRSISRTWAKDVEDLGAGVFFVGEYDGETVMRRPSEFQGRAQSLSSRFGPEDPEAETEDGAAAAAGGLGSNEELGFSKESSPMRKMLIPSVLENGQADDPPGLLKAYHFLYNNTNWYAGPIFDTYPFILTTDTTHYIHVENLVSTLLSSRPRRLLTMKDDQSFEGLISEASACNPGDFGDKTSPLSVQTSADTGTLDESSTHWAMSRTHLVSKQLIAMVGPHLQRCIRESEGTMLDSGKAFHACVQEWASNPKFWKDGYCGRLSALRYQAPTPGNRQTDGFVRTVLSSQDILGYGIRKERRDRPPSPEEFGAIYLKAEEERAEQDLRARQEHARKQEQHERRQQELRDRKEKRSIDEDINSDDRREDEDEGGGHEDRRGGLGISSNDGQLAEAARSRWIVGSGLTQPIDFTLLHQRVDVGGDEDPEDSDDLDY